MIIPDEILNIYPTENLLALRARISQILAERAKPEVKPIVRWSKPQASGRREGWARVVTGVDETVRGAKAFEGYYLNEGETELDPGTLVIQVEPCGSAKNGYQMASLLRVEPNGNLAPVKDADGDNVYEDWRDGFVSFRRAVQAELDKQC